MHILSKFKPTTLVCIRLSYIKNIFQRQIKTLESYFLLYFGIKKIFLCVEVNYDSILQCSLVCQY